MSDRRDAMASLLALSEEQFAALGDSEVLALQQEITDLYDGVPADGTKAFMELACGAPDRLEKHPPARLPVAMGFFCNGRRGWEVELDTNMLFTVVDLGTYAFYWARAMDHDKRMKNPRMSALGEPPVDFIASSTMSAVRPFDVLRFVELPAFITAVAVTIYVCDVVSNTVRVQFGPPSATRDASPTTVRTSEFLATAPAAEGEMRLLLPTGRVGRDAPVPASGLIKVTPPLHPAVTPEGEPLLRGVVMLMQKDLRSPVVARFDIPARMTDGYLVGSFAFDVRAAVPDEYLGGVWQAYLIAGDQVIGPQTLDIEHPTA